MQRVVATTCKCNLELVFERPLVGQEPGGYMFTQSNLAEMVDVYPSILRGAFEVIETVNTDELSQPCTA